MNQDLRLALLHWRMSAMYELQYRMNCLASVFQAVIALGMGLFVLTVIYDHVDNVNGWTQPQLLAVLGCYTILTGVHRALCRPNAELLLQDIAKGNLDHLLTKPVDSQLLASIRKIDPWQGVDVLVGGVLLWTAIARMRTPVDVSSVLSLFAGLLLGVVLLYCFLWQLVTLAFWFIEIAQLLDTHDSMLQAGRWPVSMYPTWLRACLSTAIPIGTAVTVPASAVSARLTSATLLGAALLTGTLFVTTRLLWRAGLRRYSGASA